MIKIETYVQDDHRVYQSSIQGRLPDIIYDAAHIIRGILSGASTTRWTAKALMTRTYTGDL